MILYGLKTCDTCRKARAALGKAGHDANLHDVRVDGLNADMAARFHAAFGEKLLNRRSATWRTLRESERAADPVALLVAHPALMKRPVIDDGRRLHLGWEPEVQAELLP